MVLNKPSKPTPATMRPPAPRVPVEYVAPREAAAYLGIALPTLNAMRQTGTGPAFCRVSPRRVVYELAGLRDYMASRTVNPSPAA